MAQLVAKHRSTQMLPVFAQFMRYEIHHVESFTRRAALAEFTASRDCLLILLCHANATVTINAGMAGLWWPLRGSTVAAAPDSRITFDRRSILVSDSQRAQDVSFRPNSTTIAILASQSMWSSVVSPLHAHSGTELTLFPAIHQANGTACKLLLQIMRALAVARQDSGVLARADVFSLGVVAGLLQQPFESLIARCPGQNLSKRKAAFLRLQRIRNFISYSTHPEINVTALAAMANYSVWHFIRVYDSVFGETPYAHISRCRVDRARKMLEVSEECVSDVALSVGFENRATLTRALKKRYGVSPLQIRQGRAAVCLP
jgi:AraC-like DNA-binding protein